MKVRNFITAFIFIVGTVSSSASVLLTSNIASAQAVGKQVSQVSTGADTACAVVDDWVNCWGSNAYGQLGNNTVGGSQTKPTAVLNNKTAIAAGPTVCKSSFFGICTSSAPSTPAVPASAMAGLTVEKVSVGKTHACAVADGKVFCWGDNSHGQLGNRTNTDSLIPVAVDVQATDVTPAPVVAKPCGGWFQPSCTPVAQPTKPKSSIADKRIVDVSAGDYFTCALADDGSVSCWGYGDSGRLGTNTTADVNYPKAVYKQSGSDLDGKSGVRLAKVSGATMCVLATSGVVNSDVLSGDPYCWGYGIGDGSLPEGSVVDTACSKSSPTSKPSATSKTTIISSSQPVKIAVSQEYTSLNSNGWVTGLGVDQKPSYWGMNGYREDTTYTNFKTCSINPCTASVDTGIRLASYSTAGTRKVNTGSGSVTGHYQGTARPGTTASGGVTGHGGGGSSSCSYVTHYGYTMNKTITAVGQLGATSPASTTLTKSPLTTLSGNVHDGLVCGANTTGLYCDANGTSVAEGQTGSGYVQHCVTKSAFLFFSTTTCDPAPTGPQKVTISSTVDTLNTGASGYTCATSAGSVLCWGVNNKGQLGVGDTVNKNVPTAVTF